MQLVVAVEVVAVMVTVLVLSTYRTYCKKLILKSC